MVDESVIKRLAAQTGVRFVAGFVDADMAALTRFAHAVEHHARESLAVEAVIEPRTQEAEWKCS